MTQVGLRSARAFLLIFCSLSSGCQLPSEVGLDTYELTSYRYQNSRSLHSFIEVTVFANGSGAVAYTDDIGASLVKEASGVGETVLSSRTPRLRLYLPGGFEPSKQGEWQYEDCAFAVVEHGYFPPGFEAAPFARVESKCPHQPVANYLYSSRFGLLGVSFGPAPAGSDPDAHFFTADQSYWLLGEAPVGFSPQPRYKFDKHSRHNWGPRR